MTIVATVDEGDVRVYFTERGYGYIRNRLTGVETFFHRTDFEGDPATIVEHARVEYRVISYVDRKQITRTKARNVKIVPAPAPQVKP
jgi:cold shock CspA family protein